METKESSEDDGLPNGVAHIRRMTCEEFFSGWEVDGELEIEEGDAEIDIAAAATTGMAVESGEPGALAEGNGYDFDVDVDSILVHGEGPSGGLDGYTSLMDLEQEEEESDDDLVTDSGTVAMVDEDVNVVERLEAAEYDDRFI